MVDLLDRIRPAARDLLDRVDAGLVGHGAPAEDPVWPALRRVRALPGEAVARLADVVPAPLAAAGEPVRRQARGYEDWCASVPMPAAWRGPAAEGYAQRWAAISEHVAGGMAGRLEAMAAYADDVARWLTRSRAVLAGCLAECLGSAEAAVVRAGPGGSREAIRAGAAIGTHVLGTVADLLDDGQWLLDAWAGRLDELPYRPPAPPGPPGTARLEFG